MPVLRVRLDNQMYELLEQAARRDCRTESGQVLYVLRRWLAEQKPADGAGEAGEVEDARN